MANADPRELLFQMLEPVTTQLSGVLEPMAVRRVLESLFLELDRVFVPVDRSDARRERLADNARRLGLTAASFDARRFAARHVELQVRRQAEEVVCLFTPVERQIVWADRTARATGLAHARALVRRGGGAVLVSAHVGPMVYYAPILTYFLAKDGKAPNLLIVANPPANRRIAEQLEVFGRLHGSRLRYVVKPLEDADAFRDQLDEEIAAGTWVSMQVDVLSGGRSQRTVEMFGQPLRVPGIWGAVRLAARHGVPVMPLCAARTPEQGVRVRIERALSPFGEAQIEAKAQAVAGVLEGWVRRNPADWALLPKVHKLMA